MSANKELMRALIEKLREATTIPVVMAFIKSWAAFYIGSGEQEKSIGCLSWEIDNIDQRSHVRGGQESNDMESDEIGTNALKICYASMTIGYVAGVHTDPEMAGVMEIVMGALSFLSKEIGLKYWVEFDGDASKKEKIVPKFLVALSGNTKERLAIFYKRPGIA